MGRIRVLSDDIANKIAAGEVVERPASVVKELLENSLDAGATDLRIEIESGGRRLIRITDNGTGMLRDDAMLAFERHATSKLTDVKELDGIATLGFRGEALPSIASVSRLVLETRSREETTGSRVEFGGGRLLRCDEAALAGGTIITVRDLFYNVPARKKFLRSEQTELAHIASLVTHYSLAHPDKSFELSHNGQELLNVTTVGSLRERVYQVFGGQLMEELIELPWTSRTLHVSATYDSPAEERAFRVRGFVSQPQVQKNNRNSIFLFVNNRLIRDRLLLHAISAAYHNLMPPAAYPFALLFLECPPEEVDVNVHPAKTEVRFRHQSFVHDAIRDTIRDVLMSSRPVPVLPAPQMVASPQPQPASTVAYSEFTQRLVNDGFYTEQQVHGAPPLTLQHTPAPEPRLALSDPPPPPRREVSLAIPDTHGPLPAGIGWEQPLHMGELADLRVLGQLHESFIIAVGRDGLWIIDQHVAHERILFEQVLRQQAAGGVETQRLLMPLLLELTAGQQVEFARIAGELRRMGFEAEPFGTRTIAVTAAPGALSAGEVERVVQEVLEVAEKELRQVSVDDLRRNVAASIACRAAIKINTRLEETKMAWLLQELAHCEYPMACPHGRPVVLRYGTREILRSFHRI